MLNMSSTDGQLSSEAYVALSLRGPITLETVTYWPIAFNELAIETAAALVCATDAKAAVGKIRAKLPIILGHECSGTVVQTGIDSARQCEVGDKVVLSYSSCGKYQQCAIGANPYCDEIISLNFTGQQEDGIATVDKDGVTHRVKGHFFGEDRPPGSAGSRHRHHRRRRERRGASSHDPGTPRERNNLQGHTKATRFPLW